MVAEAGAAKFFVRPGYTYASDDQGGANNKTTQYWISGSLGVEYYFTDHFSVQAAHGVRYTSVDSDQNGKYTTFDSEAFGLPFGNEGAEGMRAFLEKRKPEWKS